MRQNTRIFHKIVFLVHHILIIELSVKLIITEKIELLFVSLLRYIIKYQLTMQGLIEVFVEDPPYFTFLYRNREDIGDWEKLKKEFYSKSGIKHWTGDW